jgi:hypothetical protein
LLDRDPSKFGRIHTEGDWRSAEWAVKFYTDMPRPDPNPNPIGPGLLFFFAAWPAIICLLIGIVQVKRSRTKRGVVAQ